MSEFSMQELIKGFINKNQQDRLYYERNIVHLWKCEMGEFIAKNTTSVEMQNGVLYVKMNSAALRFEMMGRKSLLIQQLNEKTKSNVLKDIFFI